MRYLAQSTVQSPDLFHCSSVLLLNFIESEQSLVSQGPAPSPAAYDDGLVEVYGLTAGALKQGWNVRTVESHTKRLGQGHGLRLYVQSSDSTEHSVYTLMDGEDWWQRVPAAKSGTSVRDGMLVRVSTCIHMHARFHACCVELKCLN
jgi:hypothetical protein